MKKILIESYEGMDIHFDQSSGFFSADLPGIGVERHLTIRNLRKKINNFKLDVANVQNYEGTRVIVTHSDYLSVSREEAYEWATLTGQVKGQYTKTKDKSRWNRGNYIYSYPMFEAQLDRHSIKKDWYNSNRLWLTDQASLDKIHVLEKEASKIGKQVLECTQAIEKTQLTKQLKARIEK